MWGWGKKEEKVKEVRISNWDLYWTSGLGAVAGRAVTETAIGVVSGTCSGVVNGVKGVYNYATAEADVANETKTETETETERKQEPEITQEAEILQEAEIKKENPVPVSVKKEKKVHSEPINLDSDEEVSESEHEIYNLSETDFLTLLNTALNEEKDPEYVQALLDQRIAKPICHQQKIKKERDDAQSQTRKRPAEVDLNSVKKRQCLNK